MQGSQSVGGCRKIERKESGLSRWKTDCVRGDGGKKRKKKEMNYEGRGGEWRQQRIAFAQ